MYKKWFKKKYQRKTQNQWKAKKAATGTWDIMMNLSDVFKVYLNMENGRNLKQWTWQMFYGRLGNSWPSSVKRDEH